MIGAIIGDIVGSRFEFDNTSSTDFELFTGDSNYTDDTICTVAIADAILSDRTYKDSLLDWCRRYPHPMGAYGGMFGKWIHSKDPQPYNSFGNGSAMRVSPVGWAFEGAAVETEAMRSAAVTHNHQEGQLGAATVARIIYAGRCGEPKERAATIGHLPVPSLAEIRAHNSFNETCQVTVPQAIRCLLDGNSFEEVIRLAVSIGGDSDTIAAIAGSMAEAFYKIPPEIEAEAKRIVPAEMLDVIVKFQTRYQKAE
ncbi:MAG TPA: ADP-ribosylglycohydrolase family protein [Phnomibacter sp.]|nr:ADP-ribosylglycohydrolase family protein [Phnomibacter sp.]